MMTRHGIKGYTLTFLASLLSTAVLLQAEETVTRPTADETEMRPEKEDIFRLSGTLSLFGKFNSNLELIDAQKTGIAKKDAFIGEPNAKVKLARSWGPKWWLDIEYAGQANLHTEHAEENWFFNRANLALSRFIGEHSANLSSEVRYFTEPDDDKYDFIRHTGLLSYRHVLTPLWQVRGGYENIYTRYPTTPSLDYSVNGLFIEVRNTWSFHLTTYYIIDRQIYRGTADPQQSISASSAKEGKRKTYKAGFDWLFDRRQMISGTYTYQEDRSEAKPGLSQIGGIEGHEDTQDSEAEFDLDKNKVTLLYSNRLNRRFTFSAYGEWIHKQFDNVIELERTDEEEIKIRGEGRTDRLLLSSAFIKVRLSDQFLLKGRYLFRMNQSSDDLQDYTDHIVFIGPEFIF